MKPRRMKENVLSILNSEPLESREIFIPILILRSTPTRFFKIIFLIEG